MNHTRGDPGYLRPDMSPRNSPFHRSIVRIMRVEGTTSGHSLELDCGHKVFSFGDIAQAEGVILCTRCREAYSLAKSAG